jgi:hypothetical protein
LRKMQGDHLPAYSVIIHHENANRHHVIVHQRNSTTPRGMAVQ